jgi:hypothetical protein
LRRRAAAIGALTPGTRRVVRVVTSGGGADPFSSPKRCAAARPLSSAPSPQARTAARYRASTLDARRAVADAVDAAMNRQQRAGPEPMLELGERDAGAEKLRPGNHPMLACRQTPELPLRCAAFTRHCRV